MTDLERIFPCPTCRKATRYSQANPFRPFCSERCRLMDLGEWASESHRIAGEPARDEADNDAPTDR
ncbi:MAG: DNA gyrase inhibitor YacG [Gammaproteobacteria bacterium]|nr:DNA gyrase inhibitor YacG [Gammaproteobacteria bacterium]